MGENYKRVRLFTLITNIIDSVITGVALMSCVLGLFAMFSIGGILTDVGSNLGGIDPNGVTAGFEALGNIFGGFVMGFAWVLCAVLMVISAIVTLAFLLIIIHGYIIYGKMADRFLHERQLYVKSVRRDCIIKLIIHTIMTVLFLLLLLYSGGVVIPLLGLVIFATVSGICIVCLRMVGKAGVE